MLQELLLAMTGTVGGAIVETETTFAVNPAFKLFSDSERVLIGQIAHLGYLYRFLRRWVDGASQQLVEQIISEEMKISSGLNEETTAEGREDAPVRTSKFTRAICAVFDSMLAEYFQAVLSVEQGFLYGRILNLNEFKIDFQKYFELFAEMRRLLEELEKKGVGSCVMLDLLFERKLNGNDFFRQLYGQLFDECYSAFYAILVPWLTQGKLTRRATSDFFVKKVRLNKSSEKAKVKSMDWDNDFILQLPLIPRTVVNAKVARKILFIGKAMKILVDEDGLFSAYSERLRNLLLDVRTFDSIVFPGTIEKARSLVSEQFIGLISRAEGIQKDLGIVLDYFLLHKEEFYSVFIEECLPIIALPPSKYSEEAIRNKAFQNSVVRLNKPTFERLFKDLRFIIKSTGFEYKDFARMPNLLLVGDLEHKENFLRMRSSRPDSPLKSGFPQPSVWQTIKHCLEKNFQMDLCFKFRKSLGGAAELVERLPEGAQDRQSVFSLVFQARENIIAQKQSKHSFSLNHLPEFLAVNFGFVDQSNIFSDFNQKFVSFISLVSKREGQNLPRQLLEKRFEIERLNFADQDWQFVRLVYSQNILRVFIANEEPSSSRQAPPLIEVPFKLDEAISLDIGRCFVSLINTSNSPTFSVDLASWCLSCQDASLPGYSWSGLVPLYSPVWPVSIILNQNFFDRCTSLFAFVFPLKASKRRLSAVFYALNALKRDADQQQVVFMFSHLRVFLDHAVSAFLGYIYEDVISKEWGALMDQFSSLRDFEELRKAVNQFIDSVRAQLFSKHANILAGLARIVELVGVLETVVSEKLSEPLELLKEIYQMIFAQSEETVAKLVKFVGLVSQEFEFYGKLLLRLNFNNYFE